MASTHVNPNATATMAASTTAHHHRHNDGHHHDDPQVAQIAGDAPLPTLCDEVAATLLEGRDATRPTISRIVLVGEILNKDDPPRVFFDDCLSLATKRVNAADPTQGRGSSIADPMNIAGVFVEHPSHFFQLVESEPEHLLEYLKEMHSRLGGGGRGGAGSGGHHGNNQAGGGQSAAKGAATAKSTIDHTNPAASAIGKIHIVMLVDDIVSRSCNKHFYIEVPPSVSASGQLPETFQLENLIVDQVHKLLQLLQMAHSQTKTQVETFLSNAKSQNAQYLPKVPFIDKCITSQLCLTLDEYVSLFAVVPTVVRGSEVLHPVEEPLNHN